MKNGNVGQFLDTGWYTESVLFYNGYVYWCEAITNSVSGETTFFVDRWKAECDGVLYHQYVSASNELVEYSRALELKGFNMDDIKRRFLCSPVFDGNSFWEVESQLVWVEEGSDIII